MTFDPIYWVPVLSVTVIVLLGVVSGFLSSRMENSLRKASLFSSVAVFLFFAVHVSITMLIPVLSPRRLSGLVSNWLELSVYLPLLLTIYHVSDRWLVKPSKRSMDGLEERMGRLEGRLSKHKEAILKLVDHLEEFEGLGRLVSEMNSRLEDLSEEVEGSGVSPEMVNEIFGKIEEVKESMKGSVSRVEGIAFQERSAQLFRNLGFEVENQVFSKSDHVLRFAGEVVGIVSVKNWTLNDRNRTVNESRLGTELKKARELEVPLLAHVSNKETDRNWFHVFVPGEFEDPKETTPDWLREEKLSEEQEEKMRENYRGFHGFVDGLITE